MKPAFSAVELLLVAGISAILVAIAVPGYLEAKVKAEVTDVFTSMRAINIGLTSYYIDHSKYPEKKTVNSQHPLTKLYEQQYITSLPEDRFKKGLEGYGVWYRDPFIEYNYLELDNPIYRKVRARISGSTTFTTPNFNVYGNSKTPWSLRSIGPDQTDFRDEGGGRGSMVANEYFTEYSPTNGVFSLGEIIRIQNVDFQ